MGTGEAFSDEHMGGCPFEIVPAMATAVGDSLMLERCTHDGRGPDVWPEIAHFRREVSDDKTTVTYTRTEPDNAACCARSFF